MIYAVIGAAEWRKNMKKLKLLIMVLIAFNISIGAYAYSDIEAWTEYSEPVARLGALGILNGYDDGTFRPNDRITRAEFAKVIVCALQKEQDAMSGGYVSPFDDVMAGEWYVPYINFVSDNSIVTGYVDGTYKPDNDITYAEVSTIILRMLGYNETDLGYYWPNNYVTKANSMRLANMDWADPNAAVTRSTAAIMLDNALFSDVNDKASGRESTLKINYQSDTSLLEAIGYTIKEDVFIVATKNEDANLASNKVRTSEGTYKTKAAEVLTGAGKIGDAVINKDGDEIVLFLEKESRSMNVIVSKTTGSQLEYTLASGEDGVVILDKGFVIYDDYAKSTFEALQPKLTQGASLTLYSDNSDGWSYAVLNSTASDIIPVVASHDYTSEDTSLEGTYINKENLIVYRDSKAAVLADIKVNDVVYYNTGANIMNVYSKKITGIYYEAKPSKAYVESVVIGNVEYMIGTTAAKAKLNATSSAFEIGDRVTLLLGENDEIAYVIAADSKNSSSEYGVLINTAVKTEENGEAKYIAKIFTEDEQNIEIVAYDDYSELKGAMVKIVYENAKAKLTKISTGAANTYGEVDKNNKKIGSYSVGSDTVIMELISNNTGLDAVVEVIDFDTLEETKLSSDNVLCMISDTKFGDIRILFVKNWTDAAYSYGLVTYSKDGSSSSNSETPSRSITIYSEGASKSYKTSYDVTTGTPVKILIENGDISEMKKLTLIKSASSVTASEMGRIKVAGTVYETVRDVMIIAFDSTTRNCRTLSAEQLETMSMKSIKLYSDSKGAKIKAIIVEE